MATPLTEQRGLATSDLDCSCDMPGTSSSPVVRRARSTSRSSSSRAAVANKEVEPWQPNEAFTSKEDASVFPFRPDSLGLFDEHEHDPTVAAAKALSFQSRTTDSASGVVHLGSDSESRRSGPTPTLAFDGSSKPARRSPPRAKAQESALTRASAKDRPTATSMPNDLAWLDDMEAALAAMQPAASLLSGQVGGRDRPISVYGFDDFEVESSRE